MAEAYKVVGGPRYSVNPNPKSSTSSSSNSTITNSSSNSSGSSSSNRASDGSLITPGYNKDLAGQTVKQGNTYVTYDNEGRRQSTMSSVDRGTAQTVQENLRGGTTKAGDAATQAIASGKADAYTGQNAAYTMAKAAIDSGQYVSDVDIINDSSLTTQQRNALLDAIEQRNAANNAAAAQTNTQNATSVSQVTTNPTSSQAYTMAKAYIDSGQAVPSQYLNAMDDSQKARLGLTGSIGATTTTGTTVATGTTAAANAFDPNADYNALARQAAANGDWSLVQNYLNLRQQKIDAQGGNDRGTTNAQIWAELISQYGKSTNTLDTNADYNALARQAAANGDWAAVQAFLNLRQQKIDAQGGNDRGTSNAQIWADLIQQYGVPNLNAGQTAQQTTTGLPTLPEAPTPTAQQNIEQPNYVNVPEFNVPDYTPNQIGKADTSLFKSYLDQWLEASQQRATQTADYAVQKGVNELERARDEAYQQYQTQQNQIDIDERRALDNQALRNRINQGGASGVGEAQLQAIQAAAMTNRQTVNAARTQMTNDTARQIADLRAQGEFEKADSLLQVTQQYLSQLMQLEQWAQEYNLNVDQFNEQMRQWAANYALNVQQAEINAAQWTNEFNQKLYQDARDYNRSVYEADRAYDYQNWRDAVSNAQWAAEYSANREDAAFNQWLQNQNLELNRQNQQWSQGFQERQFEANREDAAWDKDYKLQQADRAYEQWRTEFQAGRTDAEFSQWLQRQNLALNQSNQEFNQNVTLRQLANSEQNQQWSQAMQQAQLSGSYGMAMLNQGIVPDTSTLAAMGITQSEAQAYADSVNTEKQIASLSSLAKAGITTDGVEIPYTKTSRSYNSSESASGGVVDSASSQIGYKEDSRGNTKFTDWYSEKTGINFTGQPWCAIYVQWAFDQAGLSELLPTVTASTSAFAKAAKSKKQWITSDYQPGDVVVYDWQGDGIYDHMGIVVGNYTDSSGKKYIYTVEGNTSDAVMKKSRLATSSSIVGAFRPNYAQFGTSGSDIFNLNGITSVGGSTGNTSSTSKSSTSSGSKSSTSNNTTANSGSMSDTNLTAAMRTITGFLETGKIQQAEDAVNQIWSRLNGSQKSRVTSALSKYVDINVG